MKMKVQLNYRNFVLGKLEQIRNEYVWTPNQKDISQFEKEWPIGSLKFQLNRSNMTTYPTIPAHFVDFISHGRDDIYSKANITSNDSPFEALCKVGKLMYFTHEFYIKTID